MKTLLIAISVIGLATFTFSCGQRTSGTLDYKKLTYDTTRIQIFNWDTSKDRFPQNSEPLPLTQGDLSVIDSLLKDAVDSFNAQISPRWYEAFDRKVSIDSFIIKQEKYKYQYFPFKDVNGQRVMTVIGFSTDFPSWKDQMYQPRVHYGMRMLELKVNLTEKTRDNLQSGNFG